MVISWETLLVFPEQSAATQVLVTVPVPQGLSPFRLSAGKAVSSTF